MKIKEEHTRRFTLDKIVENKYQEDKDAYRTGFKGLYTGYTEYTVSASHKTYWEIDSLIKNNAAYRQFLKSVIVKKIYTRDAQNILLTESYEDVNRWLEPYQSYPFQVRAQINRDDSV